MPRALVTAGNTAVPIDQVRAITNIFKGRTGGIIAAYFAERGCETTLLTSHPEIVHLASWPQSLTTLQYRTYDELMSMMRDQVTEGRFDVVIHSAAVSDYRPAGTYRPTQSLEGDGKAAVVLERLDSSGKIGSSHKELWMKLTPTEKIVDKIREEWGFTGQLVKFKLQVNMPDDELIRIATDSMAASRADFIVANTLEGLRRAFIISAKGGEPIETTRNGLPEALFRAVFP